MEEGRERAGEARMAGTEQIEIKERKRETENWHLNERKKEKSTSKKVQLRETLSDLHLLSLYE